MEKKISEKKISREEYEIAKNEMYEKLDKLKQKLFGDRYYNLVEICSDNYYYGDAESLVKWYSLDEVVVEDALKFARLLAYAAELANSFKYNGYKVEY